MVTHNIIPYSVKCWRCKILANPQKSTLVKKTLANHTLLCKILAKFTIEMLRFIAHDAMKVEDPVYKSLFKIFRSE